MCGRAYAVLRETNMAAVICEPAAGDDVDGVRRVVTRGPELARAIVEGVQRGVGGEAA